MNHDVYLCYDDKDLRTVKDICNSLEDKGIKCWFKNRDVGVNHIVDEVMEAISKSTLMILILSDNSKNSNFVNSEVDFAFDLKKQIFVYNIDDTKLEGSLEFFLNNKSIINSYKNPLDKIDKLSHDTLKIINQNKTHFYKKYAILITVIILISALVIVAVTHYDVENNWRQNGEFNPDDAFIKISDFHVDDVSDKSSQWNYSYFVSGQIPSHLNSNYKIITDFYDADGKLVNSTETEFSNAQKLGTDYILGSTTSDSDNINRVEVQITDENDRVLAQSESQLTGE